MRRSSHVTERRIEERAAARTQPPSTSLDPSRRIRDRFSKVWVRGKTRVETCLFLRRGTKSRWCPKRMIQQERHVPRGTRESSSSTSAATNRGDRRNCFSRPTGGKFSIEPLRRRKISHERAKESGRSWLTRDWKNSIDDCSAKRNMGRENDFRSVRTIDFLDVAIASAPAHYRSGPPGRDAPRHVVRATFN